MSTANQEQLPAIQHTGGVLLKAGAGSGKTFVLVEHLIYLTRQWRAAWESKPSVPFSEFLSEKYAATVLMTFTKLAAGEIAVRLTGRFQEMASKTPADEQGWWETALGQLDRLTVTTIDGFFYKLVRRGYFPKLPPDVGIIMDGPRQKRLLELFDQWWERRSPELPTDARRDAAIYRGPLANTLLAIFNDPALRDAWMGFSPADAHPSKLAWLAQEVPSLESWQAFMEMPSVPVPTEARKKGLKWVVLADALNERPKQINNWEQVLAWSDFVESDAGGTRLAFGNYKDEVGHLFDGWKIFKPSVCEWARAYRLYCRAYESKIQPWYEVLVELVRFLDQSLTPADGLTYGDLEYHVLREMRRSATAQRVQKDFRYFVVDEFQDTSRVQYEVLQLLCGKDYSRLFCVGDAKQAIYGFRGGELKVFLDLEKESAIKTLPLVSNYRSLEKVVAFNNAFFETIFPLGEKWEGSDPHAVQMEAQLVPPVADRSAGAVKVLRVALPDLLAAFPEEEQKKRPSWRNAQLNHAEAIVFADYIQRRLPTLGEEDTIAVLYKKLAPSAALMAQLMERGIGFTAQAKIPYADDPVAGMLHALLQDLLGKKNGQWASYMTMGYLRLLQVDPGTEVEQAVAQFGPDGQCYGLSAAFDLFLGRLGLANALHQSNLAEVKEALTLGAGHVEAVWARLNARADERWSANFRFGKSPGRVILQTSHGSKGLEYAVVLLGGLATNGQSRNQQDWIGSLPGAALWVDDPNERRKEATPQLLFERALERQKNFAESKRLFYVACTRAKAELVFVQLHSPNGQYSINSSSWSMGLERFLERGMAGLMSTEDLALSADQFRGAEGGSLPFFHLNPLGLARKVGYSAELSQGVTSELSVTRLGALLECPRKFYFKNILKFAEPEDDTRRELVVFGEELEERPLSASERGSAIHLALSTAIKHNFVLPLEWVNSPERPKLEWTLEQLRPFERKGFKLVSEEQFKFPLFEFMLTGIPDLLIVDPEKKSAEVWDFKTGRRGENKELKYWQQLEAYAYGLWVREAVGQQLKIKLQLAYVDEKLLVAREVSFTEVKESLFTQWKQLSSLNNVRLEHCEVCPYKGICPK